MSELSIMMPRGDIRNIRFKIRDGETAYTDVDEIYFSVKKQFVNKQMLFQKKYSTGEITLDSTTGYFEFKIMPDDTNSLEYGDYVFDIEVVKGDVIKQTNVGTFTVTYEVTFESNE